ncbi:hypothetical protein [Anaerotignum sp.]|uniref:hypothetical protein n=1 Tax=Anaerotignum sp. TaxID=2039241 RepID=UPI002714749C|nr:hypothetical protein [Anaerotignum sp.]
MKLSDSIKTKILLLICISTISLLELYWGFQVGTEYRGTYSVAIFIPFIIQPCWYYMVLFRKHRDYSKITKIKIISIVLISFILPLIIYYTIPNYTYNDGKRFVEQYMNLDRKAEFINYSYSESTVPVLNCEKSLLGCSRKYYYGIKLDKENKYVTVNAVSGKVTQLSEGYWGE